MPPQGTEQPRRLCPLCSKEVAAGYMWLHKKMYCPMRPGRQEELKVVAMGTDVKHTVPANEKQIPSAGAATGSSPNPIDKQFNNITPIDLTEEYQDMVKVMKKKKEEEEAEEEYQCGDCKATFNAKKQPKHCPECGIELE